MWRLSGELAVNCSTLVDLPRQTGWREEEGGGRERGSEGGEGGEGEAKEEREGKGKGSQGAGIVMLGGLMPLS